ncbi:MAG: hypothetical protein WAU91_20785 [Desulfatitalea sp.]
MYHPLKGILLDDVEFLSDATGTLAFKNEAGAVTDEELHRAILVTQGRK